MPRSYTNASTPINEVIIAPRRMAGNTTRLVDYYIQVLFIKCFVKVEDHHNTPGMHDRTFRIICDRLQREHPHECEDGNFEIDKLKKTIKYLG